MSNQKIKVVELFAGVGGFRLGLEGWKGKSAISNYSKKINSNFEVVFSNQWEPSTKIQHASIVYEERWGKENHSNEDISQVETKRIPNHDLLVGGFPCQDYSVATTLKNSKGLIGKKGVLWWSIHRILNEKKSKPKYVLLENVDRLLISPSSQRGRDFAVILSSLNQLGYAVEWRVVNAAEYGFPQRRKRIFIFGMHKSSSIYKKINKKDPYTFLIEESLFAKSLPISIENNKLYKTFKLEDDLVEISNNFNKGKSDGAFENTGIMVDGIIHTIKSKSGYDGNYMFLKDIVINQKVDDSFYIKGDDTDKWEYLKGSKKEKRTNASGFQYDYAEGAMIFPDQLDKPSRTIITGEGGKAPSRFKHVIATKQGLRRLTPIELERLNMFPDNHTQFDNINDTKRAFFMGNALVVGVIELIGKTLQKMIEKNGL
jgi:DNA (cytosine-5)-methyltransferase 1